MSDMRIGAWTIDDRAMTAVDTGGALVHLSPNELALLQHLYKRSGPSSRRELLCEVFGYAQNAESRAVDMALKRLRTKLESDPSNPVLLRSRRSVGVWLEHAVDEQPLPKPLRFYTPYYARPADEERLKRQLNEGWRVVTVVGPAGVGKTRLVLWAAEQLPRPIVVHLGTSSTEAECWHQLAQQTGSLSGTLSSIRQALTNRWCVLDEADRHIPWVKRLLQDIPNAKLLVTSRSTLHVEGEAVLALEGLDTDSALEFLDGRLSASRNRSASIELKRTAIEHGDGLPLALELAATFPGGLVALTAKLKSGGLTQHWMDDVLAKSWDPLPLSHRDVLRSLALCHVPVPPDDLQAWLNVEAVEAATEMVEQSLVEWRARGFVLSNTLRNFVRRTDAEWSLVQNTYDLWLIQKVRSIYEALRRGEPLEGWTEFLFEMGVAVERVPTQHLPRYLRSLVPLLQASSSHRHRNDVIRAALGRLPHDPSIRALSALLPETHRSEERIQDALKTPDVSVQLMALNLQLDLAPGSVQPGVLEDLEARIKTPEHRLTLRRHVAMARHLNDQGGLEELRLLAEQTVAHPWIQVWVMMSLGDALVSTDRLMEACRVFDRAAELAREQHLDTLEIMAGRGWATAMGWLDPVAGVAAHRTQAERSRAHGLASDIDLASAGLLLYLLGDLDEALRALDQACRLGSTSLSAWDLTLYQTVAHVARMRLGDPTPIRALRRIDDQFLGWPGSTGPASNQALSVWARNAVTLHVGGSPQHIVERAETARSRQPVLPLHRLLGHLSARATAPSTPGTDS